MQSTLRRQPAGATASSLGFSTQSFLVPLPCRRKQRRKGEIFSDGWQNHFNLVV